GQPEPERAAGLGRPTALARRRLLSAELTRLDDISLDGIEVAGQDIFRREQPFVELSDHVEADARAAGKPALDNLASHTNTDDIVVRVCTDDVAQAPRNPPWRHQNAIHSLLLRRMEGIRDLVT